MNDKKNTEITLNDEIPLEYSGEEIDAILDEEGSLDGSSEEVEKASKRRKKKAFELTPPADMHEIAEYLCAKRKKRLSYDEEDVLYSLETPVLGTDGKNYEGVKISKIIEAEIKNGAALGKLSKFDGLKAKELKEEYEGDKAYEFAEQELKRAGLLLNGDDVEVYVFDWDMNAFHHVGYIAGDNVEELKPYLEQPFGYEFDINAIIVGGKYKKVVRGENGKLIFERGSDGNYGLSLDVTVIKKKSKSKK